MKHAPAAQMNDLKEKINQMAPAQAVGKSQAQKKVDLKAMYRKADEQDAESQYEIKELESDKA